MTRIIRPLTFAGLIALAVSLGPTPSHASGLGLFGPTQTTFVTPVPTIYAAPTVSSFVVPTTSIVSTSYLMPTSSVVFRPSVYSVAPTLYRPATTVLPTSYLVGGSILRPTRYYLGDVVSTSLMPTSVVSPTRFVYPSSLVYPSSVLYPSSVVYDAPVIESAPVYVESPSAPAATAAPRAQQTEPSLSIDQYRQRENPPSSGRAPALESQPIEPRPSDQPEARDEERPFEPEPLSPPELPPPGEDGSIDGIGPLPALPFEEMRESRRPAFSTGVPGSMPAVVARMIQGRVRDERSGRPISGAVVTFSNSIASFAERQAVTDDRGEFQLAEFLPDGDWSIVVSGSNGQVPTRTYPQITVMSGRIYDRTGQDYTKLVLDY